MLDSYFMISSFYITLCFYIFTGLFFTTMVNQFLRFQNPESVTFKKVTVIIKSWWLIIGVVLGAGAFGGIGFLALFTFLCVLMVREYLRHSELFYIKKTLSILLVISILMQSGLLYLGELEGFLSFPLFYLLLTFPPLLYRKESLESLPKLFSSYVGMSLIIHSLFYAPALILFGEVLFGNEKTAFIVFFLIFGLTQVNDVFQFIFGKTFGKKKIVPHLSPNKTEAGFIGGLFTTTLLGGSLFYFFIESPFFLSLMFGFLISLFGILGDLTFSSVKRYFKIKDFGELLPGHGGIIDRADSLIFTAPVLFHVVKIFLKVSP